MVQILDTNILLLDAYNMITLGQYGSVVVIPETVIDEIDSKKSGVSEIAFQAREFGRLIARAEVLGDKTTKADDGATIFTLELLLDGTRIDIVSSSRYPPFYDSEANIIRDRKIIHIAKRYKKMRHAFISNDVMCRIRASADRLTTLDLKTVDNVDIEFTKELFVSSSVFSDLHRLTIQSVDAEYVPANYNYIFIDNVTHQSKLGTIASSGLINIIGRDTERELRRQDLNPINSGQLFMSKAIQDPTINIVVADARAGSGKTATAVSNAIRLVSLGKFESILYIRASVDDVEKAEEVGFLSGNDEKEAVYLHPLEDTLDFIIRNRYKANKSKDIERKIAEEVAKLKEKCNLQAMIGLGMRGRTFHNSVIIIDEAQNQSKASLQKMLTRFADDCKIIVIGSNRQIDNSYLTKYTNGLSTILDACTKKQETVKLHAVSLPKVVRGKIAEFAENLFSKE